MPLPRVRLRTLMIAVAVAGVGIGGTLTVVRLERRREDYRRKARYHTAERELWDLSGDGAGTTFFDGHNYYQLSPRGDVLRWFSLPNPPHGMMAVPENAPWIEGTKGLPDEDRREISHRILAHRAKADYHAALSRKYERAASRPWLSVPPDPLPPE